MLYKNFTNILKFTALWWPIAANQKKNKIKKNKNDNKKIEKMKKICRDKPNKTIMVYECQI